VEYRREYYSSFAWCFTEFDPQWSASGGDFFLQLWRTGQNMEFRRNPGWAAGCLFWTGGSRW
jgi:hypothetical protein